MQQLLSGDLSLRAGAPKSAVLQSQVDVGRRAERISIAGVVQGVGFRPHVWHLARRHRLGGWVTNDGDGVQISVTGAADAIEAFVAELTLEAPPLARIDRIERQPTGASASATADFLIIRSIDSAANTAVAADAATCSACRSEILDPLARRYRYPFTNCTHCGPRLSIVNRIPYDRAATTMHAFDMCAACAAEYADPGNRRFHAQPIACQDCGPRAWLQRADGLPVAIDELTTLDDIDAACTLLQRGWILAIKGLGGFQLACDAHDEDAVARLRRLKRRSHKPFALMARDPEVVRHYCTLTEADCALMESPAAPIVILEARQPNQHAAGFAPGIGTLGFMLPNTPLHHLLLRRMQRAIVLTSGNLADEPQCIDNDEALQRLGGIADYFLLHDRPIARRVDDSVVRSDALGTRMLRRARGYAPLPLPLPPGFERAPELIALGGELKNTFCLLQRGRAVVAHHIGDLEDAHNLEDFRRNLDDYLMLFEHAPAAVAIDAHPEYLSSKLGRERAQRDALPLLEVQHHHAHIAACLAEHGVSRDTAPVLGIALDGLGFGTDGTLWGGEFLRADYRECERVGTFKPVAMPGGTQAIREPWRNTYAHITAELGWPRFAMDFGELELFRFLDAKPRAVLDAMIGNRINSPLASSCGRLFDAAAAAAGICRDFAHYEGQAAIEFEALVDRDALLDEADDLAYPLAIRPLKSSGLPYVEPLGMWQALLGDLILATPVPVIAARFHKGLARVVVQMIGKLVEGTRDEPRPIDTVVLSGGVLQNRVLLEQITTRLGSSKLRVLVPGRLPANDGGISLGQAVIAAARMMSRT